MIRVTIFNEFLHEQTDEKVREIYPHGIHSEIADFLRSDDISVRTVTEYDENQNLVPNCGITDELLDETDVIIWWGHLHHNEVPDEVSKKIHDRVLRGMGAIFLHSAHHSKPFKSLMGTTCNLKWRDDEKERLWIINPTHPIMRGIDGEYFDLEQEEMYGERFDIPNPDDVLMIGTYGSHEVFRSACTWQRGLGKVFYLQPGHEAYPTYRNENIRKIIKNAVRWAHSEYKASELVCPHYEKQDF